MSLVLATRYVIITGDTDSDLTAVTGALVDAQALLEEELGRELASRERTERMYPDTSGRVYPRITPVTVAPAGLLIDGDVLYSTGPFRTVPDFIFEGNWADLTYTGGFIERSANPGAVNALPQHIERDLCWAAYRILNPSVFSSLALTPAGAKLIQNGDVRLAFEGKGAQIGSDAVTDGVWSRATLRYKRRGGQRAGRL